MQDDLHSPWLPAPRGSHLKRQNLRFFLWVLQNTAWNGPSYSAHSKTTLGVRLPISVTNCFVLLSLLSVVVDAKFVAEYSVNNCFVLLSLLSDVVDAKFVAEFSPFCLPGDFENGRGLHHWKAIWLQRNLKGWTSIFYDISFDSRPVFSDHCNWFNSAHVFGKKPIWRYRKRQYGGIESNFCFCFRVGKHWSIRVDRKAKYIIKWHYKRLNPSQGNEATIFYYLFHFMCSTWTN